MENQIPQLRFPEFTGDWARKTFGELSERIGDGLHGTPIYDEHSDIYFINGNNLVNGKIQITVNTKRVSPETFKKNNKNLSKNTLLISLNGTIGNISKHNNEKVMLSKSVGYFNFLDESNLYYYILNTETVQNLFISELTGSTIKNLSLKTLREAKISFPATLPEQTKIATFLTAVDEKLTALKQKKTLLAQYKKGVMQKIFSQELRFKDDNGNDFADWEKKKLGEVLKIGSGRDYKHLNAADIPVFGTGGLMTKVDQYLYDGETVCIGRKGTIDKPMFYNGKIWTVDTLFYTHSFSNVIPKFVYYSFQLINWKEYNEASGVPSLSKSTIEKIQFQIPSLAEQTKIANFLSAIDGKINHCNNEIVQIQTWKKGLLQQLFV